MYTLKERAAEVQAATEVGETYTTANFIYGQDDGTGKQWVRAEGKGGYSSKYYYS